MIKANYLATYRNAVTHPRQALIHLLIYCSAKDKIWHHNEVQAIEESLALTGEVSRFEIEEEITLYKLYQGSIGDENNYLAYLIWLMQPKMNLTLLWLCIKIVVTDRHIAFGEEVLIQKIAQLLNVKSRQSEVLFELAAQTAQVSIEKSF